MKIKSNSIFKIIKKVNPYIRKTIIYDDDLSFYILDENRNVIPTSLTEFVNFIENIESNKKRIVKQEKINGFNISTVFIGIKQKNSGKIESNLFETRIFNENDFYQEYMATYATWKEAEEGHLGAVQFVKDLHKKTLYVISSKLYEIIS